MPDIDLISKLANMDRRSFAERDADVKKGLVKDLLADPVAKMSDVIPAKVQTQLDVPEDKVPSYEPRANEQLDRLSKSSRTEMNYRLNNGDNSYPFGQYKDPADSNMIDKEGTPPDRLVSTIDDMTKRKREAVTGEKAILSNDINDFNFRKNMTYQEQLAHAAKQYANDPQGLTAAWHGIARRFDAKAPNVEHWMYKQGGGNAIAPTYVRMANDKEQRFDTIKGYTLEQNLDHLEKTGNTAGFDYKKSYFTNVEGDPVFFNVESKAKSKMKDEEEKALRNKAALSADEAKRMFDKGYFSEDEKKRFFEMQASTGKVIGGRHAVAYYIRNRELEKDNIVRKQDKRSADQQAADKKEAESIIAKKGQKYYDDYVAANEEKEKETELARIRNEEKKHEGESFGSRIIRKVTRVGSK